MYIPALSLIFFILFGCTTEDKHAQDNNAHEAEEIGENNDMNYHLNTANYVRDIVNHHALKNFGELMLPYDNNTAYYGTKLSDIGLLMPYHGNVRPDDVIGAVNHMIDEVNQNKTIFYDFYTYDQIQHEP